jgi:hypothetical protein
VDKKVSGGVEEQKRNFSISNLKMNKEIRQKKRMEAGEGNVSIQNEHYYNSEKNNLLEDHKMVSDIIPSHCCRPVSNSPKGDSSLINSQVHSKVRKMMVKLDCLIQVNGTSRTLSKATSK